MPDRSTRYLLDNNVFIAEVLRKWTKSTELIYRPLDSPVDVRRQGSRRAARKSPALGRGYPAPFVTKILEFLRKLKIKLTVFICSHPPSPHTASEPAAKP